MDELTARNSDLDLRRVLSTLVETIDDRPHTTQGINALAAPPGNFFAAEIKAIHDDSQSVFPESVYSNVMSRRNRWKSLYSSEFHPKTEREYEHWQRGMTSPDKPWSAPGGFLTSRIPSAHIKLSDTDKKFQSWKVPKRLTDEPSSSRTGSRLYDPDISAPKLKTPDIGSIKLKGSAVLPDIGRLRTAGTATPRVASVASIQPPKKPDISTPTVQPTDETRKHSKRLGLSKTMRTNQLLGTFKEAPTFRTLDEFLQTATDTEKDLLEKTMKLIYAKDEEEGKDAIKNVEKWLNSASTQDRQVALNFFESLGGKMMGQSTEQQRSTVTKILALLRNSTQTNSLPVYERSRTLNDVRTSGRYNPKHVRLLTPATRANKWMHQTWHHLPNYQDTDPVYNKSSIYTEPGKMQFRHWNIHPDWELQQNLK